MKTFYPYFLSFIPISFAGNVKSLQLFPQLITSQIYTISLKSVKQ